MIDRRLPPGPERILEISPGQIVRLDPGEDVTVGQLADSGATYQPFQYRTLLQISAALGIPYPYLANDMVKGNFSNSRLALIEFRRRVSAWQHAVMVYQRCRPVYARWMDAAVLSGALSLPGYDTILGHRVEMVNDVGTIAAPVGATLPARASLLAGGLADSYRQHADSPHPVVYGIAVIEIHALVNHGEPFCPFFEGVSPGGRTSI